MTARLHDLPPAQESAAVALGRYGGRWEVFARHGVSLALRSWAGGWEERHSEESGLACRLAVRGSYGFAAAAGPGARAGRLAAEAAAAGVTPGPDPLPPAGELGCTPCPPPPELATPERLRAFAREQIAAFPPASGVELIELRLTTGIATSRILTSEGHGAENRTGGSVLELVMAGAAGPARLFQVAVQALAELDIATVAEQATEEVRLCCRGSSPARQLADVVLAPAVAAPIVLALVGHLKRAHHPSHDSLRSSRIAALWHLVDERAGPDGLLPQAFDGDGLPARSITLLADGRSGPPLSSWAEASPPDRPAGGAVRPTFRQAPRGGPANLVVHALHPLPPSALLQQLDRGFWLALPAGPVHVDPGNERFSLRVAAVSVQAGKPVASHPLVELRGTFRRLLAGLAGCGLDRHSFSLGAAVTTPSLLFRRLEVA